MSLIGHLELNMWRQKRWLYCHLVDETRLKRAEAAWLAYGVYGAGSGYDRCLPVLQYRLMNGDLSVESLKKAMPGNPDPVIR